MSTFSVVAPHALKRAAAAVGAYEHESDSVSSVDLKHHAHEAATDSCISEVAWVALSKSLGEE